MSFWDENKSDVKTNRVMPMLEHSSTDLFNNSFAFYAAERDSISEVVTAEMPCLCEFLQVDCEDTYSFRYKNSYQQRRGKVHAN